MPKGHPPILSQCELVGWVAQMKDIRGGEGGAISIMEYASKTGTASGDRNFFLQKWKHRFLSDAIYWSIDMHSLMQIVFTHCHLWVIDDKHVQMPEWHIQIIVHLCIVINLVHCILATLSRRQKPTMPGRWWLFDIYHTRHSSHQALFTPDIHNTMCKKGHWSHRTFTTPCVKKDIDHTKH